MSKRVTSLILLLCTVFVTLTAQNSVTHSSGKDLNERRAAQRKATKAAKDTLKPIYPIAQIAPESIEETKNNAVDLRTPANIVTDTIYNEKDGTYSIGTRLGEGKLITTPILPKPRVKTNSTSPICSSTWALPRKSSAPAV